MPRYPKSLSQRWPPLATLLVGVFSFIFFLAAWEGTVRVLNIAPFLIPTPSAVARALYVGFTTNPTGSGSYLFAAVSTYAAALAAFALSGVLGVLCAILLAHSALGERIVMPYIVAFQTLPRIAIAPLFIIWFGHGALSKVTLATLVAFFPVLVNALVGFKSTGRGRLELMRSLKASWAQTFWLVQLPGATPYIFAGLDIALVFSILGVIVAEFVGGQEGLGVLILQSHFAIDVAGVFSVFVVLVIVGLAPRSPPACGSAFPFLGRSPERQGTMKKRLYENEKDSPCVRNRFAASLHRLSPSPSDAVAGAGEGPAGPGFRR